MADFVDYNGNNIEDDLLVSPGSCGLMDFEDKENLDQMVDTRFNIGSAICINSTDSSKKKYTFKIYSKRKLPFIYLTTYNNSLSVYTGVIFTESEIVQTPKQITIYNLFKQEDGPIVTAELTADTRGYEVTFTSNYAFWNTASLIVPGVIVEEIV